MLVLLMPAEVSSNFMMGSFTNWGLHEPGRQLSHWFPADSHCRSFEIAAVKNRSNMSPEGA